MMESIVGTPLYMAPEVYLDEAPYENSADIWSFGCIVYEVAVGE